MTGRGADSIVRTADTELARITTVAKQMRSSYQRRAAVADGREDEMLRCKGSMQALDRLIDFLEDDSDRA